MSNQEYLHKHSQFADLIRIVANEKGIDPYLVEKDYWIMHCLHGLKSAGYDFQLKGGTSLSKGFGIIHRFSEDIDIHITPPAELDLKVGKNHNKPAHINARKEYYDTLAKEINIPDITAVRDEEFDDENRYRSGGIRLHYTSHFSSSGAAAKEGVLLEVGFDDISPNKPVDISSWAMDFAKSRKVDTFDNIAHQIDCYCPSYTFVEKLQAISTKHRKFLEGSGFPANFMRHYYDVYCLLQMKEVQDFIGTEAYFEHKEKRFPKADFDIPVNQNQAFLLQGEDTYKVFEREYLSKIPLYYAGQPSLRDILDLLSTYLDRL